MKSTGWFKSTHSNPAQDCVEVNITNEAVHVRDSKQHDSPVLKIARHQWPAFLRHVLDGTGSAGTGLPSIEHAPGGAVHVHEAHATLTFTSTEWEAFTAGIRDNEFDPVSA